VGGGGSGGKDEYGAKKCVHMYVNAKMIPVVTIPGMGKGE
jgi:methylaspartate ammonia-lyase